MIRFMLRQLESYLALRIITNSPSHRLAVACQIARKRSFLGSFRRKRDSNSYWRLTRRARQRSTGNETKEYLGCPKDVKRSVNGCTWNGRLSDKECLSLSLCLLFFFLSHFFVFVCERRSEGERKNERKKERERERERDRDSNSRCVSKRSMTCILNKADRLIQTLPGQ